jgi:hypothetical protein
MFNVLIAWNPTQWETDHLMRMDVGRFKEYSGSEGENISPTTPSTLKLLEGIDTLLMYESGSQSLNADSVGYGYLHEIRVVGKEMVFRFEEKGKFPRTVVEEFAGRLGFGASEEHRTHWAIKDAGIPKAMLARMTPSYDLVFSFAGEDRPYVNIVAGILKASGVLEEFRLVLTSACPFTSPLTIPSVAMALRNPPVFQFTTSGSI